MKNNVHYSPRALRDMDEIWDHIMVELSNPSAAENVVGKIQDDIDRLRDFAEIGAPLSSIADVEGGYRFLVSGSYLVFYRADGREIYIDRVLYGRRAYLRILFEDKDLL